MFHNYNPLILVCGSTIAMGLWFPSIAQIIPDNTTPTRINQIANQVNISGGRQLGENLFHSFSDFNINSGIEVIFNIVNTNNIFTKITGNNPSNINGVITTLGTANLYLLNPNGITFGSNAKLNIGGSFIASTASQIKFADGTLLNTASPTPPLLTISAPIGLLFGDNPQQIIVNGNNYQFRGSGIANIPISGTTIPSNLSVSSGKTIALIGGSISLNGATIGTPGGRVEIATAQNETVKIDNSENIALTYESTIPKGNINLFNRSGINTSGTREIPSGTISLRGGEINILGGSVVLSQNLSSQAGGDINITSHHLNIREDNTPALLRSGIVGEAAGTGSSGTINIKAKAIEVSNGGTITNRTVASAPGGNINIQSESLKIDGVSPNSVARISFIGAQTGGSGSGGNTNIKTSTLEITNGGSISATVWNTGVGGNINIEADKVSVRGTYIAPFVNASTISASSLSKGQPGNINISTSQLEVLDSALISTATFSDANTGKINIFARDSVKVAGFYSGATTPSQIRSAVSVPPASLRQTLGGTLPIIPTGESGTVTITSPSVTVKDSARISVRNDGFGNSGRLEIYSDNIQLSNKGELTASTFQGQGGDIFLQSKQMSLRGQSRITTNAQGIQGNGGDITINTDTLIALENSDITANSTKSFGGRVAINTQGLFGTEYRLVATPQSDIIASGGEASLNGVVEINSPKIDQNSYLIELASDFTVPTQISSQCSGNRNYARQNRFTITGTGGIPQNPNRTILGQTIWNDLGRYEITTNSSNLKSTPELVEASAISHQNGIYELVTNNRSVDIANPHCI